MNRRNYLRIGLLMAFAIIARETVAWAHNPSDGGVEQVAWPDTPAGRWARAYVEAYNTPGRDGLRRFVKEYFSEAYLRENPLEKVVSDHFQTRGMLNKLDVHSVRADGDFVVSVIVPAKPYGWAEFRIELSPEPPHDSIDLRIGPTPPPDAAAKVAKDYHDWKDLHDLVEQVRRDSGAPAIAAAVVRDGKIIEKAVTGFRRVGGADRVQVDDRFHLGSVAKSFTATMIGRLVEEGVLHWDTTIGEALHDIPMRTEYRSVTLEQLLQHRGGVRAMCSTGEFAKGFSTLPQHSPAEARAALVRQVLTEEPFKTGEYAYSNAGYAVAGYMAERMAKRSWEELMRTLVFDPLELRSAGTGWPATLDRPNQPLGHYGTPPDLTVQEIGEDPAGDDDYYGPAGSVHCSIEDLARFVAFHLQGLHGRDGALRAETVLRLHTPPKGGHYMGGWGIREDENGRRRHGHQGTGGTFFAEITLYPDADLAIVATENCGPTVEPFFNKMKEAIFRRVTQGHSAPRTNDGVEWPDTIAARRARAFIEAMNAGDEGSLRRFVTENYSPASLEEEPTEDRIAMFKGIRGATGTLKVSSVRMEGENSVIVAAKSQNTGIWLELTIKLKEEPPHYWAGVEALPTAPP